jgi:hypothetical protein
VQGHLHANVQHIIPRDYWFLLSTDASKCVLAHRPAKRAFLSEGAPLPDREAAAITRARPAFSC